MGDEGSAYWIGCGALSLATRAEDGRGADTKVRELLLEQYNGESLWDFHRILYSQREPRPLIASLAQVVTKAAELGDGPAQELLAEAARHLAASVVAVSRLLQEEDLLCSYTGGVFHAGRWVLDPFEEEIKKNRPKMQVVPPMLAGDGGAVILGLRTLGVEVDSALAEKVGQQLKAFG